MKSASFWTLFPLVLSAGSAFAVFPLSSVKRESNLPNVRNRFIVEVDNLSDIAGKRSLERPHEFLYRSLRERAISFEVDREFNSAQFFVGAALTLTSTQDAVNLASTPGIKSIRPVVTLQPPMPVFSHVLTGPQDPAVPPDTESAHVLTGVDKLHAQGITGKGIKIGIIDTGTDYTHPLLGGGIGPGHKIIGGFDFVGDAYDGSNTPMPDSDPLDQCRGHGTHIAGIIGANPGNTFNISGVAFDASLSSYRVFGCNGSVTDDIIIEAMLRGVSDGQDILTMSLGSSNGWTESTSSVVASRIAASGKIVTVAAGDFGASGSWYTVSPGNGINVISVASLDTTIIPLQNATVHGVQHDPITYFSASPFPVNGSLPIFAISNDTTIADDACNPLPASTPDLSEFLVIVRRGGCPFDQKFINVAAKGGTVALIYDDGTGFSAITVDNFEAVLIQADDGVFLVQQFVTNAPVTISFPQTGSAFNFPDPNGGLISSFSSYGPTNDLFFKPALTSPGGNILSTFPVPLGSFAIMSGTSQATPFIAGSAALLFSVKGNSASVGLTARTLFETTAQPVASSHTDSDPLQTLTQQGAGLINVYNAIHTTTIVSPGELLLNDTAHFKGIQTFTVKNIGSSVKTFKLTHVPAGTAATVQAGTIFASDGPVALTAAFASVKIIPSVITVFPGQTQTIVTTFQPPKGLDPITFPVFSGFIQLTSSTEELHVSYLGLVGSLINKQVVDNTDVFFGIPIPTILDSTGNPQLAPINYTFVGDDFPTLLFRLAFGTSVLRVDLVDPNIKVTTTLNTRSVGEEKRSLPPVFTFPHPSQDGSFAQVKILGSLAELDFLPRNNEDPTQSPFDILVANTPTFANGTNIPDGQYKILLRALKVTGNPTLEQDYESWLSPMVGVAV